MAVAGGSGRRRLILFLVILTAVTLIAVDGRRGDVNGQAFANWVPRI